MGSGPFSGEFQHVTIDAEVSYTFFELFPKEAFSHSCWLGGLKFAIKKKAYLPSASSLISSG